MNDNELIAEYRRFAAEYAPDIISDDTRAFAVKDAVNRLSLADRTLMVMYADFGSYRKVAAALGVSHTAVQKAIKEIIGYLRNELADIR